MKQLKSGSKRKIIQFQVIDKGEDAVMIVLCDDGTMWAKVNEETWKPMEEIP